MTGPVLHLHGCLASAPFSSSFSAKHRDAISGVIANTIFWKSYHIGAMGFLAGASIDLTQAKSKHRMWCVLANTDDSDCYLAQVCTNYGCHESRICMLLMLATSHRWHNKTSRAKTLLMQRAVLMLAAKNKVLVKLVFLLMMYR